MNETVAGVQNDGHEQIENTLAPVNRVILLPRIIPPDLDTVGKLWHQRCCEPGRVNWPQRDAEFNSVSRAESAGSISALLQESGVRPPHSHDVYAMAAVLSLRSFGVPFASLS